MDLLRSKNSFYMVAACMALVFAVGALAQEQKHLYSYQGKRDPFVPLISSSGYLLNLEPEENAALCLEGIMYDQKGDSMAIINGELVRVGEPIADAVVSSIDPNKVTIIKDNQKVELELRREE
ncbi:MAG: hypothetical protein V1840_03080 [Candidatus Omnitrophota bacterium]